jgi:PhnB protein
MGTLKPYIFSEDARTQADFYTQSLGGEIVSVGTHGELIGAQNEFKDKVMHNVSGCCRRKLYLHG